MKHLGKSNHRASFMLLILFLSIQLSSSFLVTDASLELSGAALQGSLRGGTKVIINGQFDSSLTISDYSVMVGSYACDMSMGSFSESQLSCRTSDSLSQSDITGLVIRVT